MRIFIIFLILLLLFLVSNSQQDEIENKNIINNNIGSNLNNNNNINHINYIKPTNNNNNNNDFDEFTFNDLNVDQYYLNEVLKQPNQKIYPKITHQDIENIRQIRRMNVTNLVKRLTILNFQEIAIGIIAGLEKSINPDPGACIESLRTSIENTNQVFYDVTHFFGITIQEFITLIRIFPTVIRDDINLYNVCGADKIVEKLLKFAYIIRTEGLVTFLEYQRNALYSNPFYLIPITRGLIESLVTKNYQMLGVHIGEYLGILFNADE